MARPPAGHRLPHDAALRPCRHQTLCELLLRLDEWFLPNDPEQPVGAPMYWRFEHGLDPTPCILAYTDADRAKRQADKETHHAALAKSPIGAVRYFVAEQGDYRMYMAPGLTLTLSIR